MNNKNIKLFLLITWTVFVFFLMIWPMPPGDPNIFSYKDKVAHFILFGIFSFLVADCYLAFNQNKILPAVLFGTGGAVLFSFLSEIIQYFLPTRSMSIIDLMVGALAAILFSFIFYVGRKK